MVAPDTPNRAFQMPSRALVGFFVLTFALTWSLVGTYVVAPQWASARFGDISGTHPFFFLATWAPGISACLLVLFYGGGAGLRAFLSRLLMWRGSVAWALFLFLGIPAVFAAGSLMKGGPVVAVIPSEGAGTLLALLFLMLFLGPVEELGWRGVAQPLLQRHMAPLWAGMLIGVIWGIWHVPAFFLSGTVFATWNFVPFLIGNIALGVLVTPLFNAARGSLLWPVLFHWQLINPFWADAQPYDTWILVGITGVVVAWNRTSLLSRNGAVTEIAADRSGA